VLVTYGEQHLHDAPLYDRNVTDETA
jgi:hypothetical protein